MTCACRIQADQACWLQVDGRDTLIFDAAGLLTQRCVMAHCVCLQDAELTS